jgi:hypothetical protein
MSNARLNWTWPTKRVLGEALPEAQIQHLEISMSADGGQNFSGLAQVAPPATEHLVADLAPGTYMFQAVVVDTEGRRSATAEVTSDPILSEPEAVSTFTVVIE